MMDVFQIAGMWLLLSERLKSAVRYCMPCGPMCLRCMGARPSGPSAFDGFD